MKAQIKSADIGLSKEATIIVTTEDKPALRDAIDMYGIGNDVKLSFEKYHPLRTLQANAYAWTLINQIARAVNLPQLEVYRQIVRDYGLSYAEPLPYETAQMLNKYWPLKGYGWQCEIMNVNRENPNMLDMMFIVGSSVYSKDLFAKFVDAVISECKQIGIPTETGALKALLNDEKHLDR